MKRLLLDLNVSVDVILDRPPDADVAAALWAAIERGQGHGMVPAHGVTTIFYLLEKAPDAPFAREGVERLIGVFAVAPVDDNVVRRALALAWPDFEDAVCAAAVEASSCDAQEPSGNKYSMSPANSRVNRVIPVTVEAMPFEAHRGHLGVRHSDAARIVAAIQF